MVQFEEVIRIVHILCPLLGFSTTFLTFALDGEWEFLGRDNISPLKSVERSFYSFLNVHVSLCIVWMFLSFFALQTKGKGKKHIWFGRVGIVVGVLMVLPIPETEQMSSCWPNVIFGIPFSHDVFTVTFLVFFMVLHLLLGWISIYFFHNRKDHILFVCHGILASNSPAMMRIFSFPFLFFLLSFQGKKSLDVGEWLLIKEWTYVCLSMVQTYSFLYPPWSPIAREGTRFFFSSGEKKKKKREKRTFLLSLLSFCFVVFAVVSHLSRLYRAISYSFLVGFEGGVLCDIFFNNT